MELFNSSSCWVLEQFLLEQAWVESRLLLCFWGVWSDARTAAVQAYWPRKPLSMQFSSVGKTVWGLSFELEFSTWYVWVLCSSSRNSESRSLKTGCLSNTPPKGVILTYRMFILWLKYYKRCFMLKNQKSSSLNVQCKWNKVGAKFPKCECFDM